MTREEAIQVLQTALTAPFIYGAYANALKMAIEALKGGDAEMSPLQKPTTTPMQQSPSDGADLISRADVLALAEKGYIISNSNYKKVCDLINELPSASTQTSGDFISRADAIKAVHKYFMDLLNDEPYETDEDGDEVFTDMKSVNTLLNHNKAVSKAIKSLPSADRPSGEWTYLHGSIGSYMTMNCPFCGETFNNVAEWKYNYCPNCGAEMKGEKRCILKHGTLKNCVATSQRQHFMKISA